MSELLRESYPRWLELSHDYPGIIEVTTTNAVGYNGQQEIDESSEIADWECALTRFYNPSHSENDLTLQIHLGLMDLIKNGLLDKETGILERAIEQRLVLWQMFRQQGATTLVGNYYQIPEQINTAVAQRAIQERVEQRLLEEESSQAEEAAPIAVHQAGNINNLLDIKDYKKPGKILSCHIYDVQKG